MMIAFSCSVLGYCACRLPVTIEKSSYAPFLQKVVNISAVEKKEAVGYLKDHLYTNSSPIFSMLSSYVYHGETVYKHKIKTH